MSTSSLEGIFPYLVTPTEPSGKVKENVLADLVEYLISRGVHGLTPLGSTGEGAYLPIESRFQVAQVVVDVTASRIPVVACVNSITTTEAIKEARQMEAIGVDGIVIVLPTYFPLEDREIIAHFRSVAVAVNCPVVLYSNPKFSNWDFTIAMLRELSQVPNIKYIKDASGNMGKLLTIMNTLGPKIKVFSASADIPLFVLMMGGVGWMAGPACLIPEHCVKLYDLARGQKWEQALSLQKKIWAFNEVFQKYSLAACVKTGLEIQGFPVGKPLAPQSQLDSRAIREIEELLTKFDVSRVK